MATAAELPEDDEAWLYGETEKKDGEAAKNGDEAPSELSAEAQPFEPAGSKDDQPTDDKEAGEVSGEDADNGDDDDDEDSDDDDDVQVTIGDIKTQPTHGSTYEKFKSSYTRSGQAPKSTAKGVDLETPGLIDGVSVYDYDLNSLNAEDRPWRKPGADITDYFNYGFTEDTWVKYCEKQGILRNENGCSRGYNNVSFTNQIRSIPQASRPRPAESVQTVIKTEPVSSPGSGFRAPTTPTPTPTTTPSTTTAVTTDANGSPIDSMGRRAGPPPGRKMSGTIDVIGGTRNDSRRPKNQYDYDQNPTDNNDYKKWQPPHGPPPSDLPPPHIPPPGYGPPPPMNVPPPGPPPPHMGGPPPMSVPPPGMPPRLPITNHQNPFREGYYPPPSGPPPQDRGPPPGYDGRGGYGGYDGGFGAPPPGYGAPPPNQGPPPGWDTRGAAPYNDWEFRRDRSPARSDSDFSSSGDEYQQARYRGNRDSYDAYERDLNYERNRQGRPRGHDRGDRGGGDRDRDRERDRPEREDRSRSESRGGSVGGTPSGATSGGERERRHRDRERSDREKEERHRKSSRKEGAEGEHRSSKHKKSKRSKRDRDEEPMDTAGSTPTPSAT